MTLTRKLRFAALSVCAGWAAALLWWKAAPFTVTFDDAYYYFTIGRNLAHGHGSTFDLIDRTNGYHPLWQGLSVLPYWLGLDDVAAVRALLLTQLALWAGTLWLLLGRVGDAVAGWPALGPPAGGGQAGSMRVRVADALLVVLTVVLVANPFLLKMVVNGLESGIEVPIFALLLVRSLDVRGRLVSATSRAHRLGTGALLGLAFLARTDAVLLFAAMGLWCLLDSGPGATAVPLTGRATRTAELLALPAVAVATYLALNAHSFGTALQISGTVKRVDLTAGVLAVGAAWAVAATGVLLACRRPPSKKSQMRRLRRFLRSTGWAAAFSVMLLGYYATFQEVPYLWYFCPLALYAAWAALLCTADLAEAGLAQPGAGRKLPAAVAPALIVVVPLLIGLVLQATAFLDPGTRSLLVHDAEAGRWMRSHVAVSARAASWDAGAVGYFSHRSVVNLDGVVNSKAWYDAMRHGTTARFLRARGVRYLVNHGGDVGGHDPDILHAVDVYFGPGTSQGLRLLRSWAFTYNGSLDGSRTDTSSKPMGTYVYEIEPAAPVTR